MTNFLTSAVPFTCLLFAAACGGSNGGSELDSFEDRILDAQEEAERIAAIPGTAWAQMPTRGTASFAGSAALIIDPIEERDDDDIVVIGDASLTANFGRGSMTGTIDNMQGITNLTETDGDMVDVNGVINIGNDLSIIGDDFDDNLTDNPNDWLADYNGLLTIEGDRYEVEGILEGQFVGTRANPASGQSVVRGIIGFDEDGYATVNGQMEEVPAYLEVFGENR